MRRVIYGFIALLLAVWSGIFILNNPGYLTLSYGEVAITCSLWLFILVLLILFTGFYLILRVGGRVYHIFAYFRGLWSSRRLRKARHQTARAFEEFLVGKLELAETRFARAAKYSDLQLINYVAAAMLAQQQGASRRCEQYLQLAFQAKAVDPRVVDAIKARFALWNAKFQEAQPLLQRLHTADPKNRLILRLLKEAYWAVADWKALVQLLPTLNKYQVLEESAYNELEITVYENQLRAAQKEGTLELCWSSLPQPLKKRAGLVAIYAEHLLQERKFAMVENLLKVVLHHELPAILLRLYAAIESPEPLKQLNRAEQWLKREPHNPELLLALGRLCKRQKLWGKQQAYLELALKFDPNLRTAHLELAEFFLTEHKMSQAVEHYRQACAVQYLTF